MGCFRNHFGQQLQKSEKETLKKRPKTYSFLVSQNELPSFVQCHISQRRHDVEPKKQEREKKERKRGKKKKVLRIFPSTEDDFFDFLESFENNAFRTLYFFVLDSNNSCLSVRFLFL